MQFNKISKLLSLAVMFLFFGLFFNNVVVSAIVKIDTQRINRKTVFLYSLEADNTFNGFFWVGEDLDLSVDQVKTLELLNGLYICETSDLYQAIDELKFQLTQMDIEADNLLQLYQDGELSDEYRDEYSQSFEILQKQLKMEIVNNLIKYRDQCLTR